jgi:uncharacterized protein
MDRELIVQRLREYFAAGHDDVAAVYLFGSFARGKAKATSDVDIAVLYRGEPDTSHLESAIRMADELFYLVDRKVDVVVLNHAPPDLSHEVLRRGELVMERDPSLRIAFEVRARNAFFDLLPTLARYRRIPEAAFD